MFGQPGQPSQPGTFTFGAKTTQGSTTSASTATGFGGFTFGTATGTAGASAGTLSTTGLFSGVKPAAAPVTGFSLGSTTGSTALLKPSINFAQAVSTSSGATGLPATNAAPFSFGATSSFGAQTTKPTGTATSFSFASTTQPKPQVLAQPQTQLQSNPVAFGQATSQPTGSSLLTGGIGQGLSLQKSAASTAPTTTATSAGFGFQFGGPSIANTKTATAVPSGLTTGLTTGLSTGLTTGLSSLSSAGGFKLGGTTATTTTATASSAVASTGATTGLTTGFAFGGLPSSTSAAASSSAGAVVKPLTSTAPSGGAKPTLTYKQLEDLVNKWVHELEDQERMFLNQASQVNTWDRLLIENGEKITELHSEVERVKAEQKRLDRELDFILSQQQDLEEILQPLEEQLKSQQGMQYLQHADLEREKTYKMAENVDVQLKRMTQDLREIIEHINCSNINTREAEDPMTQIAKILNAHMDSLQWVDQNTSLLQRRVDDVSKQMEARKRDHERTVRLSFD